MDNDYEAVHDLGVQICHKCSLLATHFCKTCQDNLCKVCIIKHYQNTNFTKNHDILPINKHPYNNLIQTDNKRNCLCNTFKNQFK